MLIFKIGEYEIGDRITSIAFNWTLNKPIKTQTLTDCEINVEDRSASYDVEITADKTFTLTVSDGEKTVSANKEIKFMNKVYFGSSVTKEIYDSAFILDLTNSTFKKNAKGTYTFDIQSGEYGFIAAPSTMSISTIWIGGFEVTLEDLGTVPFTNNHGYTTDYNIYKTYKSGLGNITGEIK